MGMLYHLSAEGGRKERTAAIHFSLIFAIFVIKKLCLNIGVLYGRSAWDFVQPRKLVIQHISLL